jgi:hypothetical protein
VIPILPRRALELSLPVPFKKGEPEIEFRRLFVANRSLSRYENLCQTLTVLIPRFYNPDRSGNRRKVEQLKLKLTETEIRRLFGGYTVQSCTGWDGVTRVEDPHLRFEVDLSKRAAALDRLRDWKRTLERRFRQTKIYMKVSRAPGYRL